jgi:hypothetical protein
VFLVSAPATHRLVHPNARWKKAKHPVVWTWCGYLDALPAAQQRSSEGVVPGQLWRSPFMPMNNVKIVAAWF